MAKLADLFVKLGLNNSSFNKGLKDSEKKTSLFGNGVKKIGGLIAGAFAVTAIVSFGKELLMLGGIAEGVRNAFNRIADDKTLEGLTEATKGTVSQLELMKRAVSAHNLGLPVEKLAKLFEFATKRAQETGESVDFLVNSIVTGIGRKSPLILDNLGISAIDLRKKLKGVGMETATVADIAAAVGEIAADSMRESGEIIDTNAIKVSNLGAQWDNIKVKIAESKTVLDAFTSAIDTLDKALTVLESEHLTFWEKINIFQSQDKTFEIATKRLSAFNELSKKTTKELNLLLEAETKRHNILRDSEGDFNIYLESAKALTRLRESIDLINKERQDAINHIDEESNAYRNQIAAEQEANETKVEHVKTIGELKAETEELTKSLDLYGVTQEEEIQKTLKQIAANKQLLATLLMVKREQQEAPERAKSKETPDKISANFVPEGQLGDMTAFIAKTQDQLERFTKDFLSAENAFIAEMNANMEAGIEDFIGTFAEGIGRLASGDIGFKEFFSTILDTLGQFLMQMGKMLIAYGIALEALTTGLDPFTKIAAGIALVAIGGAISGLASKGPSGAGSVSSGGSSAGGFSTQGRSRASQDRVVFELEGTKLIGVINNTARRNSVIS